ncbi:Aste57867_24689 [Aphanomyces stellatus]|uniref:phospholipase D n=1 Tax=Aphanomyces stellatus TaxID=120398 RepID=A0A485LR56_9STRA|nr:hypothetical protein As57867_024611 [Aphanomyces stellatus]VFU01326.1 Aste57867_24689 [Aphanomyces stellatus]
MSDISLINSNKPRSFAIHVDDVRICRKRQLIPSCLFRGRVKVGKLPEWTIQFSQKELLRLHVCVNWYLLCHREKLVWMPWTLIWEKRAAKRCQDKELVERYLRKLAAISLLHDCEALMSFLEVSTMRLESNLRSLSLKEGYVHMKINGPNQIPLQKFCSRRMEKVYRHSYRIFLRISFVACMLLLMWPFLIITVVAVVNPGFLNQFLASTEDILKVNNHTLLLVIFVTGVLFCLGFIYKFFERRLGTVRRWAALKSNCLAFYRDRKDKEPSEVFLFDTHFEAEEGNYQQGVSWMVNGLTIRNKGGYTEVDCGHYYTRLLSVLGLSLSFFIVMNISASGYQYQDMPANPFLVTPTPPNFALNGSYYCGYVFAYPRSPNALFRGPGGNVQLLTVDQGPEGSYIWKQTYAYDGEIDIEAQNPDMCDLVGILRNFFTQQVLNDWLNSNKYLAVMQPVTATTSFVTPSALNLNGLGPLTIKGLSVHVASPAAFNASHVFRQSNLACYIPIQYTPVTASNIGVMVGALLAGSMIASCLGLLANYVFSWVGMWHAHVRRDLWLKALNDLPTQPQRHRFLSFAPARPQAWLKWHVDGHDTYQAMRDAILSAKHQILIAGWWVCPDILLERHDPANRIPLKELLLQKAQEGVLIHILLYQEVQVAMDLGSHYAAKMLKLHHNIRVLRDPSFQVQSFGFWSHHEKVIVVDSDIAFVGGLDLAFGRYDTCDHSLSDPGHDHTTHLWPGKDYSNPIIKDFVRVNDPHENLIDRNNVPRMPWHDVHCSILGPAVQDVAYHFIERWNFVCSKRDNALRTDWCVCCRTTRFKYLPRCIVPWSPDELSPPPPTDYQECALQVLRSVSSWSAGVPTECSIHTAYCDRIRAAKHYVYIENQFFVSGLEDNVVIMNRIVQALVDRIRLAVSLHQVFRVFVVMPLLPGIEGNVQSKQSLTHLHAVMHWQYETIRTSLMGALSKITSKPEDYVMFFGLRTYGVMPNGRCVTEQIYIHSKVFISDDTTVICGSANINDRSMNGDRDSEIAVVVEDVSFSSGVVNGRASKQGTLATRLRLQLFQEHLGLADPSVVLDPTAESTWQFLKCRAQANTDLFEQVFRCAPSNTYRSFDCFDAQWHQLDAIYENQRLNPLKGRAAWSSDNLLEDGDYSPWTDVNGVPIPMDRVNWDEYVVVPDPLFPLLSTDDQGWYYARNFKIFQEMRVNHHTTAMSPRVRKRDKFQHFMADRLLAQVRRRKYVKLSTLPVLNDEYMDMVPVLRDDDKDTFYAKWRQWATIKLKPPVLPSAVTEYREMIPQQAPSEAPTTRHSDGELSYPRQRPVLRLSESDVTNGGTAETKDAPRSWMFDLNLPLIFHLSRSTADPQGSQMGDNHSSVHGGDLHYDIDDDDSKSRDSNVVSPSPSIPSSLPNEPQLGNVHTNAETEEVTAQATLRSIQGHLVVFPLDFLVEETLKPSILPRSLHI